MKFVEIPEGYIYTSHKNNEFQKVGSNWINCNSGSLVESHKITKLEVSAKSQINEYNEFLRFKIGESYFYNNVEYICNGVGKFSCNNRTLTESTSTAIYSKLTEDDVQSSTEVPIGYVYTTDKNRSYIKKPKGWQAMSSENYLNSSAAVGLEDAARRKIDKFNETAATPIGWKFTSKKGIEYTYVGGDVFLSPKYTKMPQTYATALLAKNERKADVEKKEKEDQKEIDSQKQPDGSIELQPDAFDEPNQSKVQPNVSQSEPKQTSEPVQTSQYKEPKTIEDLASVINSHPSKRKIIILLNRGDALSLLAADILLSNKTKEAVNILNSLK